MQRHKISSITRVAASLQLENYHGHTLIVIRSTSNNEVIGTVNPDNFFDKAGFYYELDLDAVPSS